MLDQWWGRRPSFILRTLRQPLRNKKSNDNVFRISPADSERPLEVPATPLVLNEGNVSQQGLSARARVPGYFVAKILNPPKIMRIPSTGRFCHNFMISSSAIIFFMTCSRCARDL